MTSTLGPSYAGDNKGAGEQESIQGHFVMVARKEILLIIWACLCVDVDVVAQAYPLFRSSWYCTSWLVVPDCQMVTICPSSTFLKPVSHAVTRNGEVTWTFYPCVWESPTACMASLPPSSLLVVWPARLGARVSLSDMVWWWMTNQADYRYEEVDHTYRMDQPCWRRLHVLCSSLGCLGIRTVKLSLPIQLMTDSSQGSALV